MRRRRSPEVIAGRVNADGSIAAGDGFTVVKSATGTYDFTFSGGFRLIAATASVTGSGTASWTVRALSSTDRTVQITTQAAGVATDSGFAFVAAGIQ